MSNESKRFFAGIIALVFLMGFAGIYGWEIYKAWFSTVKTVAADTPYQYVATVLAGLVGSVVAMIFNQKLPDVANSATRSVSLGPQRVVARSKKFGRAETMTALVDMLKFSPDDYLTFVSLSYVVVYFLIGSLAILTWFLWESTPLIRNLALICFGLFLAIGRSFFDVPQARS